MIKELLEVGYGARKLKADADRLLGFRFHGPGLWLGLPPPFSTHPTHSAYE